MHSHSSTTTWYTLQYIRLNVHLRVPKPLNIVHRDAKLMHTKTGGYIIAHITSFYLYKLSHPGVRARFLASHLALPVHQ